MVRRRKPQRGVLLLIVLSLLVLFVLIGVTFIVVAGQYTKSAKAFSQHELKGDTPSKELDGALMQLLRGTDDPNQMMWRHNLLRDLYGHDGFEGVVVNSTVGGGNVQGQQFLAVVFSDLTGNARASNHYYAGSVFTLMDGQGEGRSTRILRYQAPTFVNGVRQGSFILEAFDDMPLGFVPVATTRFAVNGKPFNGTGDGFDPQTGKLDAKTVFPPPDSLQFETALLPLASPKRNSANGALVDYGDSDESWDAADYQNLFLARIPSQMPLTGIAKNSDPLIPSFHRPYLINYWMHRLPNEGRDWRDTPAVRRSVVARPMPDNHPFFTGGNPKMVGPALNVLNDADSDGIMDHPLIRGPWDVDNDNDGVADSIWIDLGSPIKSTPDGRLYKPLFAILCVDMDGRLNVNAHGTREILAMPTPTLDGLGDAYAAGPTTTVALGQGYGPAEIRLDGPFTSWFGANGIQRYARLLSERYRLRFGELENPPAPGLFDNKPYPNNTSFLSSIQLWGLPSNFLMPAPGEGNLYATPPDLAGVGGTYLDYSGQPRFVLNQQGYPPMGVPHTLALPSPFISSLTNAIQDSPYEIDLVTLRAEDSVFGEEELEELLRQNDMDMQMLRDANTTFPPFELPASLSRILAIPIDPPNPISATMSHELTTRSFDIPALNAAASDADERKDLVTQVVTSGSLIKSTDVATVSIVELATQRLLKSKPDRTDLQAQLQAILPPEVRDGRRMDLNRLFGNGIDDNGNGVVDEPIEWAADQKIWAGTGFEATGQFGSNPFYSRQEFARHLFCLAMLAMDEGFRIPLNDPANGPANDPAMQASYRATARRVAQWAINVVDFRDSDAIMTPFEYDWDPFDDDGWSVDDQFTTDKQVEVDRQIVWGSESPELLITETLAFHDRRIRDTDMELQDSPDDPNDTVVERRFPQENGNNNPLDNIQEVDETLDQYRIPQGSLFVELYATGNPARNNTSPRRELYNADGTLDLGRVAADGAGRSPVWRIAIARVPQDPGLNTDPADLQPMTWKDGEQAVLLPALLDERTLDVTINWTGDNFRTLVNSDAMLVGANSTGAPETQVQYDRFIIFTDAPPASLNIPKKEPTGRDYYYNHNPNANVIVGDPFSPQLYLTPGEYAVVGPRPVTAIGSRRDSTANSSDPSTPSYQTLVLRPTNKATGEGGLYYYDFNIAAQSGLGFRPLDVKPALPIIVAADPPSTWDPANRAHYPLGIGVNVSEPTPALSYYREPKKDFPSTAPRLDPLSRLRYEEPPSYYADLSIGEKTLPDVPLDNPLAGQAYPLADFNGKFLMTGTHRKFRVALLQRLADPTRSWNPATNPYLTVDSQPIDLTVFNGEEDSSTPPPGWDDPNNPMSGTEYDVYDDSQSGLNPDELFESRERGSRALNSPYTTQPATANGPNVWNPISRVPMPTQITDNNPERSYWGHALGQTLGYLNSTYGFRRPAPPELLGAPTQPIPWLTWNNRPYVSQFELLLVPSSAPWRLTFEMRRIPTGPTDTRDRHDDFLAPWAHLLNFFYDNPTDGANNPNFVVLLDWLEVPSRFAGTQKWLNPQVAYDKLPQLAEYGPPFNKISRFRDPGKININTVPDALVWQAIDPQQTTNWPDVQVSLNGTESPQNRPAFYGNPVRSAASADLMPLHDLETSTVDATLLRRDLTSDAKLLFDFPSGNNANDSQLHPYFQYQKIQRLANLLTTHSNVYAVWITVGHFEVYPWNAADPRSLTDPSYVTPLPDAAHPDGYQLGAELDSDRGLVRRHRGFYIIDRSIPVGYQPGQDLNIDRMILLRRMIE